MRSRIALAAVMLGLAVASVGWHSRADRPRMRAPKPPRSSSSRVCGAG